MFVLNDRMYLMTRCYFGGNPQAPPSPAKPPALADAAAVVNASKPNTPPAGYGSTVLTSGAGLDNQTSKKKTLLGG